MSKRKSIEEVKKLFRKAHIEPLFEVYNNYIEKLLYRCSCGELAETSMMVINGGFKKFGESFKLHCPKCKRKILSDKKNDNQINKVRELFRESSSEFMEYISGDRQGSRPTIKFRCGKCGDIVVQFFKIRNDKKDNPDFLCETCIRSIRANERMINLPHTNPSKYNVEKYSYELVRDIFLKHGVTPLFDEYKGKYNRLKFICKCGNEGNTTLFNIEYNHIIPKCGVCTKQARRELGLKNAKYLVHKHGKNHPNWNPILTDKDRHMSKYGRGIIEKMWKQFILKLFNYTCIISGQKGGKLSAHHLNAWARNPEQRYRLNNGVCISREYHEKFHDKYGMKRGDNTKEQFKEFYEEETGKEFKENDIVVDFIEETEYLSYLLNIKKELALDGKTYIPFFIPEIVLKQNIVLSMIRYRYGLIDNKFFARNLKIEEIKDFSKVRKFLDENHIQGYAVSSINLALIDGKDIMSLMTFTKNKDKDEYILQRFCSQIDTVVVGGASKLLKFFIRQYNPDKIITYGDVRFAGLGIEGSMYTKLGFKYSHRSKPNYWYTKDGLGLQFRRKFQRYKLDKIFNKEFDKSLSERDIMLAEGYQRLYDCGNHVFIYEK